MMNVHSHLRICAALLFMFSEACQGITTFPPVTLPLCPSSSAQSVSSLHFPNTLSKGIHILPKRMFLIDICGY